jgi:UDP-N-acetylglucosamine 1-carboxyvinyltransferase
MPNGYLAVKKSSPLSGTAKLTGAKNAVLTIMSSLILTSGKSILKNVPNSSDVKQMIKLLESLGAIIIFDRSKNILSIDTSKMNKFKVCPKIMNKMRASILVMGPLLARFGKAEIALPGGCLIGARPIDFHLNGFKKVGAKICQNGQFMKAALNRSKINSYNRRIVLAYPSVGATENIMMCASLIYGNTTIVNAALEPEVLDLADALKKMGAKINFGPGLFIEIEGVNSLNTIEHTILPDRLEAGSIILAAAITGGEIKIPNARPDHMDAFLEKLKEMGHTVFTDNGVTFKATKYPRPVDIKTAPYPGFPTDLQAPMMSALCLANGVSKIDETVFENRLIHVQELQKMGAQISVDGNCATVRGVDELYGSEVIASDIRASCALAIAGLAAQNETKITGVHHWQRGYDRLEKKIAALGGEICLNKNKQL